MGKKYQPIMRLADKLARMLFVTVAEIRTVLLLIDTSGRRASMFLTISIVGEGIAGLNGTGMVSAIIATCCF